jgi:hypothetical protein
MLLLRGRRSWRGGGNGVGVEHGEHSSGRFVAVGIALRGGREGAESIVHECILTIGGPAWWWRHVWRQEGSWRQSGGIEIEIEIEIKIEIDGWWTAVVALRLCWKRRRRVELGIRGGCGAAVVRVMCR